MRTFATGVIAFVAVGLLACGGRANDTTDEALKNRPVTKVINLLKDMLKQLEKDGEEDQAVYDRMACWCETNDRDKSKAIGDAESHIAHLNGKIDEHTATSARLASEIKNLQNEVAQNQAALDQATALRQEQLAGFNGEENDLLESISALKAAIAALSKHHGGAFLQVSHAHVMSAVATLQRELQKHAPLFRGVLSPKDRRMLASFTQQSPDFFDATPTFRQGYAPQSGEIFGILNQMLETFEANLADSQKDEVTNQKAYEDLKAAKLAQIAAAQEQINMKTDEKADIDAQNAEAKTDNEDTQATKAADEQFLAMVKDKCQLTDSEWEARQKTRQLEMEAVSKALAILSTDDAHDLFTKTFNTMLVQTGRSTQSDRRARVSMLLSGVAKKFQNPRLATLAVRVKLDAFTRVIATIDKMIAQLQKDKSDEQKQKDFCVEEFNQNQLQTERKTREKTDLTALVANLESTIKQLTEDIAALKAAVAEMQVQLKRATENREKENQVFQTTVADQRETQRLLRAALGFLKGFYAKGEALVQKQPAGVAPPAGFDEYKHNSASSGVMGTIQQIIDDAKAMEAEAIRAEEDALKTYEDFVKATNQSINAYVKEITDKSEAKAQAEVDLAQADKDKASVEQELDELSKYNAELHQSCDFVTRNFDVRQVARDEEIEALRQAKAILSGSDFVAAVEGGA